MDDVSKRRWPAIPWRLAFSVLLGVGAGLAASALDKREHLESFGFGDHRIVACGWPEIDRKHYSGYRVVMATRLEDPSSNVVLSEGPKEWTDEDAHRRNVYFALTTILAAALLPWLWPPFWRILKWLVT